MEMNNIPEHIAIILDGNRRWAANNNMKPSDGHRVGADTLERIAKYANKIGLKYLTVFAFSTENWKREKAEVDTLMKLLELFLNKFINLGNSENIRVKIIGEPGLSDSLIKKIKKIENKTKDNTGLTLCLAINYGGRQEILHATKELTKDVLNGKLEIDQISEYKFESKLYTADIPNVDLLIRTSGEQRISNFLLWQLSYAEFIFIKKHWPEFEPEDLIETINIYNKRNRRFGGN